MSDSAADGAAPTETYSIEFVNQLKAQLESAQRESASNKAKYDVFESKERERISAFAPEAKAFIDELIGEADADAKTDMAPLASWANDFTTKKDILSQAPLARMVSCASAKLKRVREEASVGSKASETLGATMKELEQSKAADTAKAARISELEELVREQQSNAKALQDELAKAGLMADRFDFSKASSREKEVSAPEPAKIETPALTAVTSNASRASGNPIQADDLFSHIMNSGNFGSGRVQQSGSGHALLGAASGASGEADLMAALRNA